MKCGHCGLNHPSVAEVRTCHEESPLPKPAPAKALDGVGKSLPSEADDVSQEALRRVVSSSRRKGGKAGLNSPSSAQRNKSKDRGSRGSEPLDGASVRSNMAPKTSPPPRRIPGQTYDHVVPKNERAPEESYVLMGGASQPSKPVPPRSGKSSRTGRSTSSGEVWSRPVNREEARRATPEIDKQDENP